MMTSIAALYELRNDLEAQRRTATRTRDACFKNGETREAHGYDLLAAGLTRAIETVNAHIARERQANETHRSL